MSHRGPEKLFSKKSMTYLIQALDQHGGLLQPGIFGHVLVRNLTSGPTIVFSIRPQRYIDVPNSMPRRFEHIHVHLVGPLPPSRDRRYILAIKDCCSRCPEEFALKGINANTFTLAFLTYNYISRFEVPLRITFEQRTQFTSKVLS
uniref:Uncharacterized protein n=1 Tax=Glossina austeni TaxID=7395 RepID=A0A1A9V779_GLOAU